jgi:hypothetical protein
VATPAFVNVTEGSGKRLAASTYTENSQTVYDQKVIPGEPYLPEYTACVAACVISTGNAHLIEIMAGSSLNVRIRRIVATQVGGGTVTAIPIQIWRINTAGSGGPVVTPGRLDPSDAVAGATSMTLPSSKGTEQTLLWQETFWTGAAFSPVATNNVRWQQLYQGKPIIIPAGTSNGIALKNTVSQSSATLDITVEFTETTF